MTEPLQFMADEGFDKQIVVALREEYDVFFVAETMPAADDEEILAKAYLEGRIVLTLDKDFGELAFRKNQKSAGVILCRIQGLSETEKCMLVKTAIATYGKNLLDAFTVIQPKNLRIRKL